MLEHVVHRAVSEVALKMSLSSPDEEFAGSLLLSEFAAEREEIRRHKWLQSEKAQRDIGFEIALMEWIFRHRSAWLEHRRALADSPVSGAANGSHCSSCRS